MSKKTDVKVEAVQEKKVSKFDRFFKISERGSNVKTEIIAGLTTFSLWRT